MIDSQLKAFCKADNFAILTTILPSGDLQSSVMWVDCDEEALLFNTEIHRAKYKNIEINPRVTVLITDSKTPYSYVEVRGKVDSVIKGVLAREQLDDLSFKYLGKPYAVAVESERVILRILPLYVRFRP